MMDLGKPQLLPNLKPTSAVAEILKRDPQFLGAPLTQGHTHFVFWWDLLMGLGKLQLLAKFDVPGFIYYGNLKSLFLDDKFAF